MSLTDKGEVKKILGWAEASGKESLIANDDKRESFWTIREKENTYIMPYSFKTVLEFEKIYDSVFQTETDSDVKRIISIAAFSCREAYERRHVSKESALDKIPEHIYVF